MCVSDTCGSENLDLSDRSVDMDAKLPDVMTVHKALLSSLLRAPPASCSTAMSAAQNSGKRSVEEKSPTVTVQDASRSSEDGSLLMLRRADDVLLAELGYKSEFRREFTVRAWALALLGTCHI